MSSKIKITNNILSSSDESLYLVTGANKDRNQERIEQLQIRKFNKGENVVLRAESINSKDLASMIDNRIAKFITALRKKTHREGIDEKNIEYWEEGAELKIYKCNDKVYIRTDANKIEKDNLGELPEFLTFKKYFNKE